jgi:hypothetical protein
MIMFDVVLVVVVVVVDVDVTHNGNDRRVRTRLAHQRAPCWANCTAMFEHVNSGCIRALQFYRNFRLNSKPSHPSARFVIGNKTNTITHAYKVFLMFSNILINLCYQVSLIKIFLIHNFRHIRDMEMIGL